MPTLPTDGIFSIDLLMRKGSGASIDAVIWQWKDDRSLWHPYTPIDSKIIEVSLDTPIDSRIVDEKRFRSQY